LQVIFRVDGSEEIGSGHVVRCITLADQLLSKGAKVRFITRAFTGGMQDFIESHGFTCSRLDGDINSIELDAFETYLVIRENYDSRIDWLIVDHYDLDYSWESFLRPVVKKIMVIDDLANRKHDCDLLLDQNYYKNYHNRYDGLVQKSTKLCLGTKFALLNPNFFSVKKKLRRRDGVVRRILVFFGSSDIYNQTELTLNAIEMLGRSNLYVDVVVGNSNPQKERIRQFCLLRPHYFYHCQIPYMADLIAEADLSIGAGGTTTWERCFLGLPSIISVVAENQVNVSRDVSNFGAAICLGWAKNNSVLIYENAIRSLIDDKDKLLAMERASKLIANVQEAALVEEMYKQKLI